jgi:hypothetical protein
LRTTSTRTTPPGARPTAETSERHGAAAGNATDGPALLPATALTEREEIMTLSTPETSWSATARFPASAARFCT